MQWLRMPAAQQPSTGVVTGAGVWDLWRHTKRMMAPDLASLSLSCSTPEPKRSCQGTTTSGVRVWSGQQVMAWLLLELCIPETQLAWESYT